MMDKIKTILESAPIDMSDILRMESIAAGNKNCVLLAGSANAHLLALMDGIGLGTALTTVEQPCVITCTKGAELRIMLNTQSGSIRASSLEDLALRLSWPENSGAYVEVTCPGDLLGKEKIIFAILDGMNYRTQLNDHAIGCSSAQIVIDAVDAPSMEVYQFAKWLGETCGLAGSVGVFVSGKTDEPNCAPAIVMAMQMGLESLPVTTCNTARESIGEKLCSALSLSPAASDDADGIGREMVRCALGRLTAEKERLQSSMTAPVKSRLSLADRFAAQVPGTRVKIQSLITAQQCDLLNSDLRDFSIFLQHNIEELLVSSIPLLEMPKEAMRAFAQGYISEILSDYSSELIYDLCRREIAPALENLYAELFDLAWIRQAIEADELPESALDTFSIAMESMSLSGEKLLNLVFNSIITKVIARIHPILRIASFIISKLVLPLIHSARLRFMKPEKYAANKAKQLVDVLDKATAQYQDIVRDSMLPQIEEEILFWFDDHVSRITEALRAEDMRNAENAKTLAKTQSEITEMIQRIEATVRALENL